ncbi:MAG: PaaI family thioesterase [Magnetovibrionaceae bacterium]
MIDHLRPFVDAGDVEGLYTAIPYGSLIGLSGELDDQGRLITCLEPRSDNVGNAYQNLVHGGVIAGLLEHAAVMALIWEARLDTIPRVVNISVDFLRPAKLIETRARADVIKQGRRVANLRVTAWQDDEDRPVAAAHSHCLTT